MEDFVTYKQAVQLKELGFDYETYGYYHYDKSLVGLPDRFADVTFDNYNNTFLEIYSAPTLAQVQKWLREVKQIEVWVEPSEIIDDKPPHQSSYDYWPYVYDKTSNRKYEYLPIGAKYEDALSNGIDQALEILTDKTEKNESN